MKHTNQKAVYILLIILPFVINPHFMQANKGKALKEKDSVYLTAMKKVVSTLDHCYSDSCLQSVANTCERLMQFKPGEWLPRYYYAYALINLSFQEKQPSKKTLYCEKAFSNIKQLLEEQPKEAEVYVLEALYYYAKMEINPMINAIGCLRNADKALDKALELDKQNPRMYFLKGKSAYYTPKFMGGGADVALPFFIQARKLYKNALPKSAIHPHWGRNAVDELYKTCKASKKD